MSTGKKKRGKGRPVKLTPELQHRITGWVAAGNYVDTAAALSGVSRATLYVWMRKGRKQKTGVYRDFLDALQAARAEAETRFLAGIDRLAEKDWRAYAWRLEHMFPTRYRDKAINEIRAKHGVTEKSAVIILPDNGRMPATKAKK